MTNIEIYWWKINEGTGSALDYGTAGNDMVSHSTFWATGGKVWDPIFTFNGSTSYLQMNGMSDISLDTAGTFSAWVYLNGDNNALNLIFNVQNYALSTYLGLYCSTVGATTTWAAGLVADGTALWDFMYSGGSPIDTWVHVVLTHDGTTPKLYINGTNVNITFNAETDKTAWMKTMFEASSIPKKILLGGLKIRSTPYYLLRGKLQDFRYINYDAGQDGVDYLYNSGNGITLALKYNNFNPVGNPQYEIITNQNNLTILE